MRVNTATRRDGVQWSQVEEILEQLDPETPTADLLVTVSALRTVLCDKPLHSGRQNGDVLRALYRLLDLEDARLLARVLRLVLIVCCGYTHCFGLQVSLLEKALATPRTAPRTDAPHCNTPSVTRPVLDHQKGRHACQRLQNALQAVARRVQR
jgi:hypothetical protein